MVVDTASVEANAPSGPMPLFILCRFMGDSDHPIACHLHGNRPGASSQIS